MWAIHCTGGRNQLVSTSCRTRNVRRPGWFDTATRAPGGALGSNRPSMLGLGGGSWMLFDPQPEASVVSSTCSLKHVTNSDLRQACKNSVNQARYKDEGMDKDYSSVLWWLPPKDSDLHGSVSKRELTLSTMGRSSSRSTPRFRTRVMNLSLGMLL